MDLVLTVHWLLDNNSMDQEQFLWDLAELAHQQVLETLPPSPPPPPPPPPPPLPLLPSLLAGVQVEGLLLRPRLPQGAS